MDRKGLIDLSGGYLTEGEPLELAAWSCCIVGASTIDLSAASFRVQIFRKQ